MIEQNGIRWYKHRNILLPRVPPHIKINLSNKDAKELLSKSKAYFIRYTNEWDRGDSEFWYVIKDSSSRLEDLSGNTRSKVRRGLKKCIVERVNKEEIAKYGHAVCIKAYAKYNKDLIPVDTDKKRFIENTLKSDYDNWAVYSNDNNNNKIMIAYSQNIIQNNSCTYSTIKFNPDYLKLYPSYALFFAMNQYYLEEKGFLYVSDGAKSIMHESNIQDYLMQKFKFRIAYCKLNILYRMDIKIIVNILYPFRKIVRRTDHRLTNKISILLKHEKIRRSCNH